MEAAVRQPTRFSAEELNQLKVPPHSVEAEQSVLGGLMIDNEAWDRATSRVGIVDFYQERHRTIFIEITRLAEANKPFDVVTVCDALEREGSLEQAGGLAYLGELAKNTPSAANISAYADIVRERSVMRQLLQLSHDLADKVYHPEGLKSNEILDKAEQQVFAIAEQGIHGLQGPQSVKGMVPGLMDKLDALMQTQGGITGLRTHYQDLDQLTSGLQPADLLIIAGRPSMGKTTFAMNIAENVAMDADKPVLVFSMEMPNDAIMLRVLSSLSRVDQTSLRSGQLGDHDWSKLFSAMSLVTERMNMFVDDAAALSPSEMRMRARRLAREHGGLSLIVVDYLQLMQIPGGAENRTNEVAEISRSLKAIAKELNVPVVALSQLSRKCEERTDKRPMMSDLRESGGIEQDADVIMFVYRDEVYHPNTDDKGIAEILVRKHRNGPIGEIRLTFQGQFCRFDDFAPERI